MDITPALPAGRQLVQGYGDHGFTISGLRHEGSLIVFPGRVVPWPAAAGGGLQAALTEGGLEVVLAAAGEDKPDILLVGCGRTMSVLPRDLRTALRAAGIVAEPMDTGAACRTYNVLLMEGRRVAAALVAI